MRIAMIRRRFSASGGAELYVQRLIHAFTLAGHEVHLFAESWDQIPPGVALHRIPAFGSRSRRPYAFAELARIAVGMKQFDCVFSLERTLKQDVYRAGDGVHRVWLERRRAFAPWWRRWFIGRTGFHRNMLKLEGQTFDPANTGHVIVNSEMVKEEIIGHFHFPAERIQLVRNGVDLHRFKKGDRAGTRARYQLREHQFLLLFAGSGWERKGLKYLLRAVKNWSPDQVRLMVIGKGKQPAAAPPHAIFTGVVDDIESAYAAADLFALLPIYEPSANVCFEALAAGLPVVTTSCNGASDLIQEAVNGSVIANPADTAAVVKAIEFWMARRKRPVPVSFDLSMERNVSETMAVLELAAKSK